MPFKKGIVRIVSLLQIGLENQSINQQDEDLCSIGAARRHWKSNGFPTDA